MQFQHNISRRIINTEIHQQNYGQKTGGQNDEKTLELKNNVELNEQVTYEEKIEKNAIPETLMRSKERKSNTDTNRVHSNDTSEQKKHHYRHWFTRNKNVIRSRKNRKGQTLKEYRKNTID